MTQLTSNDFEAVAWPQLVWSLTRRSISVFMATNQPAHRNHGRCTPPLRQRDQILPPPDLWHQQCRHDILRIEARRLL